jgi:hypothetical protein
MRRAELATMLTNCTIERSTDMSVTFNTNRQFAVHAF